ncbi:MAG: aquaporin [Acidimicrobiia bacterium]|nr:aquaporin [Acidimicrobiia bacterium]
MVAHSRILMAEAIGTFILMMGGPGTAVLAADRLDGAAVLAIALGFGLALMIAAYAVGPISGCHINPAVTLGLVLMRKVEAAKAPAYLVGQVVGAMAGGAVIYAIAKQQVGVFDATPGSFATNLWGQSIERGNEYLFFDFWGMVLVEVILTALLVFVVLATTSKKFAVGQVGLTVGMTLTLIHLVSIPVDNTSVNPVRSLGMAYIAGGEALEQLWAFIVFPLVGAVLGVLAWMAVDDRATTSTDGADSST